MSIVRHAAAVAAKDLRIEARGRHGLTVVLPFAGTLLVAFGLSLGPGRARLQELAPALLWLAVLFASILAFRRSYETEAEDAALEGLILSPVDRAAIFLGKGAAVFLQLLALEAALLVLAAALFGLSPPPGALGVVVLGTVGLSAIGSMFGVMAGTPRFREAVLPLLVLPLAIPVLLAGIEAMRAAEAGRGGSWLGLLAAFDVVFVSLGVLVFDHLLED